MRNRITDEKSLAAITSGNEYELALDITVSSNWVSLRNVKSASIYGNGFKIKGLRQPLFGIVSFVKLYDLSVECDILEVSGRYVGGFMRYGLQATLSGCSSYGFVSGGEYVGGLAGDLSQSTIENSSNYAEVSASAYFGGIVGCASHSSISGNKNYGLIRPMQSAVYGGGIAGKMMDECFVCDNLNTGTITEFKTNCCGGITGGLSYSRVFQGNVNRGIVNGGRHVGGLVGIADNSAIIRNESIMPVTGHNDNVGGVVGYAENAPVFIFENISSGAIDCTTNNAGGVAGLATDGVIITNNTVTCSSVRAKQNIGRVLGSSQGEVFLDNTKVHSSIRLHGINGELSYLNYIVFPDDPGLSRFGNMGETFIPPLGFKSYGLRLSTVPENDALDKPIVDNRNPDAKAVAKLSDTLNQISASLSIAVSALANAFQVEPKVFLPVLRDDKEAIAVLRSVKETFIVYCDFIENAEAAADSMTENDELSLPVRNRVKRIIITCDSERTNQPLQGATAFVRGKGYDCILVSDAEGRIILDELDVGDYEVTEHTPPHCFKRNNTHHKVTILLHGAIVDGVPTETENDVPIRIGHERDESTLYLEGESWAARPEAFQDGLILNLV